MTIPNSVTSIGPRAFDGCTKLTKVTCAATKVPRLSSYVFDGVPVSSATLIVPAMVVDDYKNAEQWKDFGNIVGDASMIIASGNCGKNGDNIKWKLTGDGTLTLTGSGEMKDYSYSTAPWYDYAKYIKQVLISDGITNIGEYAFHSCFGLTSITIPNSVTNIGSLAFAQSKLTSVTIPNSVTNIGSGAFSGCLSLNSVIISNSVARIEEQTFYDCISLTSLAIPNSVTSIGSGAFEGCSSLTSVTIPSSVTSIGERAFEGCSNLPDEDGIIYESNWVIGCKNDLVSANIKEGTIGIGDGIFRNCSGLTSVAIPNSVTRIGVCAFEGCIGLSSVTISNPMTNIGKAAFVNCTGLTSVTIPNSVTGVENFAFSGCSNLPDENGIIYVGKWVIGCKNDLVTADIKEGSIGIGSGACDGCSSLTSVTIPTSVTSIGEFAFNECDILNDIYYSGTETEWNTIEGLSDASIPSNATIHYSTVLVDGNYEKKIASGTCGKEGGNITWVLTDEGTLALCGSGEMEDYKLGNNSPWVNYEGKIQKLSIDDGITNIGNHAFSHCRALTSVTIPNSVTSIGECAFWQSGIKSINLPQGLKSIGNQAFEACDFSEIYIPSSVSSINGSPFNSCSNLTKIEVDPDNEYYTSYNNALYNKSFTTLLLVPSGYTSSIIVKEGVTKIGDGACRGAQLSSITLPCSLKVIGSGAFNRTRNLKEIIIPEGCTYVDNNAFAESKIEKVHFPSTVSFIGDHVFSHCSNLAELSVDDNNSKFCSKDNVLYDKAMTHLIAASAMGVVDCYTIPNGVTAIDHYAFCYCRQLKQINIPSSVKEIGECAFEGCDQLESVDIPEGIETLNLYTFRWCTSLKTIYIPATITSISGNAFSGCNNLERIICKNTVPPTTPENTFKLYNANMNWEQGTATGVNKYYDGILYVPSSSIDSYKTAIGWNSISNIKSDANIHKLQYVIDNEVYKTRYYEVGEEIEEIDAPAKDGSEFTGWSGFPTDMLMHDEDLTIIGHYSSEGSTDEDISDPDTRIENYDNIIYLDKNEAFVGKSKTISVKMKNTVAPTGFQFDMYLPEGVTVAKDEDGFCDVLLSTERTTIAKTNTFDSRIQKDGSLRVLAASTKNYVISGNDGEVCTIKLNISEDMEEGDYPIILKEVVITDASGQTEELDYVKCTLTISSYTPGDVNGDNKINVGDFSAIASHIMGETPEGFVEKAADVNGDNKVNVGDLSTVVSIIMDGGVSDQNLAKARVAKASEAPTDLSSVDNVIYPSEFTVEPGGESELVFNMKNDFEATGFQFDFVLPEGLTIPADADGILDATLSEVRTTSKKTNTFECGLIDKNTNTYRILVASTQNYAYSDNDGEVVRVRIKADESIGKGEYPLTLSDIVLTDARGATYETKKLISTISVDDIEFAYEEGYSLQTSPFMMDVDGDYELSVTMVNKDAVKSIEFDLVIPEGLYIDGEDGEYFVDLGSRVASSTVINQFSGSVEENADGSFHVLAKFKRTTSSYVFTGNSGEALLFPMFADGLVDGVYTVEMKNVVLNGDIQVAPYKTSFVIGEPSISGDVMLYGVYDTESIDILNEMLKMEDANITCENLVLSDGADFSVPASFKAANASYSRPMTNQWGTIVLPYEVASDANVEYYIPNSVENGTLKLTKLDVLPANTPALVAKVSGESISANASNVAVCSALDSSVNGNVTMHGSYANNTKVTDANAYYIKNNQFWLNNGYFYIDAFRAYFTVEGAQAKSLRISPDGATMIDALVGDGEVGITEYYDASGARISNLRKGVNIVRLSNGETKKIIVE